MTETYSQAKAANWPRPTCIECHSPTVWGREYKASGLCTACYIEQPSIITLRKELLHAK